MKSPTNQAKSEQKADTLWKQFNPDNQDIFWKQYEKLLQQLPSKNYRVVAVPSPQPMSIVEAKLLPFHRFQEPIIDFKLRVVLAIMVSIALLYLLYAAIFISSEFPYLFIAGVVSIFLGLLYRMVIFDISSAGLLVTSSILRKQALYTWKEIRSVHMDKDLEDTPSTPKVTLHLKNNQSIQYTSPMRDEKHHTMAEFIRQQGVSVEINF